MTRLPDRGKRSLPCAPTSKTWQRLVRLWRPLAGLILGLALLALAARGVDLGRVWAGIRQANPAWVAVALLTVFLTTAAKVGRWRRLFPRGRRLRPLWLARALVVGQLGNALLPARLGDLARSHVLGRTASLSRATVLGTVAAEKVLDVLFLLIVAGLSALAVPLPPWLHGSLGALAGLGMLVVLAGVILPRRRCIAVVETLGGPLPAVARSRLVRILERGLVGMDGLRRPGSVAWVCAWSAVIWGLAAATNLTVFWAFDLPLFFGAALFLLTLLHVGMVPPSSPGRLGVFHAVTVVGLGVFGVERAQGLACAAVLHAVVYAPQILLGALALLIHRPDGEVRA